MAFFRRRLITSTLLIFVFAHIEYTSSSDLISDFSHKSSAVHGRQKRLLPLTYLNASALSFICGFGVPVEELDYETVTAGVVFKAQYRLPRTPQDLRQPMPLNVNGRNAFEGFYASKSKVFAKFRWSLYKALAVLAEQLGYRDGRACVLRSICESAAVPFHYGNGIVGDLAHILLTPSSSTDELSTYRDNEYLHAEALGRSHNSVSCATTFEECTKSILKQCPHIFEDSTK